MTDKNKARIAFWSVLITLLCAIVLANRLSSGSPDPRFPQDTVYRMTLYRADGVGIYKEWVADGNMVLQHVSENLIHLHGQTGGDFVTTGMIVIEGIR